MSERGLQRELLASPWDEVAFIIYEGHFSIVHHYHIRMMLHLKNDAIINMWAYYFLMDLTIVTNAYQKRMKADTCIFH